MSYVEYFETLELAAEAGDAESAWALAESLRTRYDVGLESQRLYFLEKAAMLRHPAAQRSLGFNLVQGSFLLKSDVSRGLRMLVSGWLGAFAYRSRPLQERLLQLAKPKEATILLDGQRQKISYRKAECGVRIFYENSTSCQIAIEQLPKRSINSVTNNCEHIATQAVYRMLLSGIHVDPAHLDWIEVYPAGGGLASKGSAQRVSFNWDGVVFSDPKWGGAAMDTIKINLSDILVLE
jgi:TPR repeat protein